MKLGSKLAFSITFIVLCFGLAAVFLFLNFKSPGLFLSILLFFLFCLFFLQFNAFTGFKRSVKKINFLLKKCSQYEIIKESETEGKDEFASLAKIILKSEKKFFNDRLLVKRLLAEVPLLIITCERGGKIIEINNFALKVLGYERDELLNKKIDKILVSPGLFLQEYVKEDENWLRGEFKYKDNKEEALRVSIFLSVKFDKGGEVEDLLFVAKDSSNLIEYARERLSGITPILQRVALGDFSQNIDIPEKEDEFTEHLVALSLMLDDFRNMMKEINEKTAALQEAKSSLEQNVKERTRELQEAKEGLEKIVLERTGELRKLNASLEEEVKKRTLELQEKLDELETFKKVAVGRELKMIELKEKLKEKTEDNDY